MNRYMLIGCIFLVATLQCSTGYEDTRTEVDHNGFKLDRLVIQIWKGGGSGGETAEFEQSISGPVFFAEGKANDSQTVIIAKELKIKLHAGHYYALTTEVNSQGVANYFDFIAALRTEKNRDVWEKYNSIDSWTEVTLLLDPVEDVIPDYFAIRLYGQGKVFAKPFYLCELTKNEFEQKKVILAAKKIVFTQKRLEKVFLPYKPSLPLPAGNSPLQFKIWGTAEDSFPPAPYGWRQIPGEQSIIESAVADRLKSAEYLIYGRPATVPIYQESIPKISELVSKLSAQATPGEYEPLTFAVYASKNLERIRLWITDLKSEKASVISKDNIDIRTVNYARKIKNQDKKTYYLMPLTLGKGPDQIEKNSSRRYWLTIFLPASTKPGLYSGNIHFEADNSAKALMPVEITVLPFALLDPPIARFMWNPPESIHPENEFKMYQDMATHGFSTMMLGGGVKTRDQKIGKEDIESIAQSVDKGLNTHKKLGFRDTPIGGISNNQIIFFWDKALNWFRYWPITQTLDKELISVYHDVFLQNNQAKNRSKLLHYVVDEPGGANPKNLEPAQHYLKLLKKELPQLKTFVTIGGGMKQGYDEVGMLSPYLDVTCTNYVTKDVIERLEKLHSAFWIYNGSSLNVEPIKERFFFGWFAWKIGAKGIGQWTYAWTDSPFSAAFRDDRQDYGLETRSGYLPTSGLEMIREGIDDYRYLYTLTKLIQHGLRSDNKTLNQTALSVNSRLAAMREKINLNYLRGADVPESKQVGMSAENLDSLRNSLARFINALVMASNTSWPALEKQLLTEPEIQFMKPSEADWR